MKRPLTLSTALVLVLSCQTPTEPSPSDMIDVMNPVAAPAVRGAGRPPVIDGRISPGEWAGANTFDFVANVPEGGTTPARLFLKHDGTNLFLAVRIARTQAVDGGGQVVFEFDNDGDGLLENGNDVVLHGSDGNFFDDFRTNAPPCEPGSAPGSCGFFDTSDGGTNDGVGAYGNNGTFAVYEIAHPLNSTDDTHDFSLTMGQTLGVSLELQLFSPALEGALTLFPGPSLFSYTLVTLGR